MSKTSVKIEFVEHDDGFGPPIIKLFCSIHPNDLPSGVLRDNIEKVFLNTNVVYGGLLKE